MRDETGDGQHTNCTHSPARVARAVPPGASSGKPPRILTEGRVVAGMERARTEGVTGSSTPEPAEDGKPPRTLSLRGVVVRANVVGNRNVSVNRHNMTMMTNEVELCGWGADREGDSLFQGAENQWLWEIKSPLPPCKFSPKELTQPLSTSGRRVAKTVALCGFDVGRSLHTILSASSCRRQLNQGNIHLLSRLAVLLENVSKVIQPMGFVAQHHLLSQGSSLRTLTKRMFECLSSFQTSSIALAGKFE